MSLNLSFPLRSIALWLALTHAAPAQLTVTPLNETGIYQKAATVGWRIALKGVPPEKSPPVRYTIKQDGGVVLREGTLDLTKYENRVLIPREQPGTLMLEAQAGGGTQQKHSAEGGAIVRPAELPRSSPRPPDFDEFWQTHLDELAGTPMNAVLVEGSNERPTVSHWRMTMDLPKGRKMQAQLARPHRDGKFPAMVIFQYAGVYGLPPGNVTNRAAEGWLVMNVNPHDLPLDETAEFYQKKGDGPLRDYISIGNDDREKSYFLRMFLSCVRAVDYLASRPDWDGRTLVVTGTSQGGLQSVVAAGLNPKVTAMVVNVPAGCDDTAPLAGRGMPWPYWLKEWPGKNREALIKTCSYFDAVNFSSRVKCPSLVCYGLLDRTATPSGVQVMINELAGPVERVVMPASGHKDNNGSQNAFKQRSRAWFDAMKLGKRPPVNKLAAALIR